MYREQVTKSTDKGVNQNTITSIYKIFENGKVEELDQFISKNVIEHTPDPLFQGTGLEYVKDLFKTYKKAFSDLEFTINEVITENDKSAVYITMTGTNDGPIMGRNATNKKVKVNGIDILKFVDGKVNEHWGVWDNLSMMTQLGFMPEMKK